jgi:hypothetical protein
MKKTLLTGLWLLFFCISALAYEVEWYVLIIAGGEFKKDEWCAVSALGEPICGQSAGGDYSCSGGYLASTELPRIGTISLQAKAISPTMVRLTWTDLTNEEYYSLYRNGLLLARLPKDTILYEDTFQLKANTKYQYLLKAYDAKNILIASATATVELPVAKYKFVPYHNLFHPAKGEKVSIYYKIDSPTHVSIKIYNLAGELVKTLVDEDKAADQYWVYWYGKNDEGALCAAGVYIIQIKTDNFKDSKKIILIK